MFWAALSLLAAVLFIFLYFSLLQVCGDEVQLFSLDEEFDYDSVALTPKFSEAEMKAIINLSVQKKVRLGLKSPECEDWSWRTLLGILC